MKSLGGFICLRHADENDFCWRESIRSILPCCDLVSVSVASDDLETERRVRQWMDFEPKLSLNIYEWKNPSGNEWWFNEWLQHARQHTRADMVLQMDADEILDPSGHAEIHGLMSRNGRFSVWMRRLNFWRDHRHLIPHGKCCADRVIRIAPQDAYLASDGYDPKANEVPKIAIDSGARIFHYGWLRKKEAFFKKERFLQGAYFGTFDKRLAEAEKFEGNWMEAPGVTEWKDDLVDFREPHPIYGREWLKERGYSND